MEFPLQVGLLVSMVGWRRPVFSYRHAPVTAIMLENVFVPHVGHAARFSMCHINRFSWTLISHNLDCWHTSIQSRLLIKRVYRATVGGILANRSEWSRLSSNTVFLSWRHLSDRYTPPWKSGNEVRVWRRPSLYIFIFSWPVFIFVMKRCIGSGSPRNISCRHRGGSRGLALLMLTSAPDAWMVSATPWPFCLLDRTPVPIIQGAGWAPGLVWMGMEKISCFHHRSNPEPSSS
jgi:hypothetical protein